MYVLEDCKALRSLFPMWAEVHVLWKYLKTQILFSFKLKMVRVLSFLLIASKIITTCSQTTPRVWHVWSWPQRVQVWSSSLKPLLSGLSWACLDAADVCLADHVRTDCSYSGCQLYIQTSQQDIWWLPFFLCRWNSQCPFFPYTLLSKNPLQ